MNPSDSSQTPLAYAAYVGIDWADQKHCCSLQAAGSNRVERCELDNSPEAVAQWAAELAQRFPGQFLAVALEQTRGAVVALLSKYAHLTLYPIHPASLDSYRKTFRPSGAVSDHSDANLILDLLQRHRDQLKPLHLDTEPTRSVQFLVEDRRRLVDEKTRQSNRLTDCLKQVYPQVLRWFGDVASPLVGDLLQRWPTLADLQQAEPNTLRAFLYAHNCRDQERIERCLREIPTAVAATHDGALLLARNLAICCQVKLIAGLREAIANYDKTIAGLYRQHPDFFLIDSLPGAGAALGPRILAALGTDRDRFSSASELQCFSGIAPVVKQSGKQQWIHSRWACPKFIRQTFHEWAPHTIPTSAWAREYYHYLCNERNKSHHAAIRALAYKWLRIIFRCWKDRKPYDEQIYLPARNRRRSPPSPAAA